MDVHHKIFLIVKSFSLDFGDSNTKFTIQSAGKCLNYALALDQLTADVVLYYHYVCI